MSGAHTPMEKAMEQYKGASKKDKKAKKQRKIIEEKEIQEMKASKRSKARSPAVTSSAKPQQSDTDKQAGRPAAARLPDSNVIESLQAKVAGLDFERPYQQAPASIVQEQSAEREPQIGKSQDLMNKMKTFGKKDTTRRQESHDPESEVEVREVPINDRGGDREHDQFKPGEAYGKQTSRLMQEAQKSGALALG